MKKQLKSILVLGILFLQLICSQITWKINFNRNKINPGFSVQLMYQDWSLNLTYQQADSLHTPTVIQKPDKPIEKILHWAIEQLESQISKKP